MLHNMCKIHIYRIINKKKGVKGDTLTLCKVSLNIDNVLDIVLNVEAVLKI